MSTTAGSQSQRSRWNPLGWHGWSPNSKRMTTPDVGGAKVTAALATKPKATTDNRGRNQQTGDATGPARRQVAPAPKTTADTDRAQFQDMTRKLRDSGWGEPNRPPARPIPVPPSPRHAATTRRSSAMTASTDDLSLQAWGRRLNFVGPALRELAAQHSKEAAEAKEAADAVQKMAQQADSDLPVSNVLNAEMQTIAAEMRKIQAEAEARAAAMQRLADRAEALPQTYRREHETDEDRLTQPRKSRAAEKRADVTSAEQDT